MRCSIRSDIQPSVPAPPERTLVGIRQSLLLEEKVASTDLPRGGCRMRCRNPFWYPAPCPGSAGMHAGWDSPKPSPRRRGDSRIARRSSLPRYRPAFCPGSAGTHAVRDSLASDFPLRGTGKSDQCVDQMFALVDEHPTGVFDSDSNPNSAAKEGHPEWDGPLLARCKVRDSNP